MQEEVENRTLTLVVSGTKFTGRMFKAAISKYMAHRKEKKLEKQRSRDAPVVPHGKQTVKQLVGQNQGISNIEITDPSIAVQNFPKAAALALHVAKAVERIGQHRVAPSGRHGKRITVLDHRPVRHTARRVNL